MSFVLLLLLYKPSIMMYNSNGRVSILSVPEWPPLDTDQFFLHRLLCWLKSDLPSLYHVLLNISLHHSIQALQDINWYCTTERERERERERESLIFGVLKWILKISEKWYIDFKALIWNHKNTIEDNIRLWIVQSLEWESRENDATSSCTVHDEKSAT